MKACDVGFRVFEMFWVGLGLEMGFIMPKIEQIIRDSPTANLSKWGVYRCPSLSEVKRSETVAQR